MMRSRWLSRILRSAGSSIDAWLDAFSIYGVPAAVAIGTVVVLVCLPHAFQPKAAQPLQFKALDDKSASMGPVEARAALSSARETTRYGTKLSETPIWIEFLAPASGSAEHILDFPSRHATSMQCWLASTLAPLGRADREHQTAPMRAAKAGFAIPLDANDSANVILCRATYSGPAQVSVLSWGTDEFHASELDFQEGAALIAGGLLTLACFVFVTALINREWTYVLFSMWLVGNLRMCANAMGWDTQWVDRTIPSTSIAFLRELSFAAYYIVTGALFSRLFRRELRRTGFIRLYRTAQWTGVLLLVAALVLPYSRFILALWSLGGFGICVLILHLAQFVRKARSRTVMWYVGSLAVVLGSTFSELIGAVFGVPALAAGVSPVLAALTSSMMAAFAIAEQMRAERQHRQQAEIDLRNTYDVAPVGLFTLDAMGRFVRANPALLQMLGLDRASYRMHHWNDFFEAGAWGKLESFLTGGSGGAGGLGSEPGINGMTLLGNSDRRFQIAAIRSGQFIEGSLQDVTERSKAVERLRFLAEHDSLTGLLNRRGVESAIAAQSETLSRWVLVYIDLDRFKLINDLFGHQAGDEVLRLVAKRIVGMLDERCSLGRIGGDEFVCIMKDVSIDEALEHWTNVVNAINDVPYQVGNRAFMVKASIGLTECEHGMRVQDALAHTDRACREAKHKSGNSIVAYRRGAEAFEHRAAELRLVESFRGTSLPPGLFLLMQPIMSLSAPYDSLNFEVLLRMRSPEGQLITPDRILSAAEESGAIAAIDMWVVKTTLEWISGHQAHLANTQFICVNLNGASLNDERFTREIFDLLVEHRAVLQYLCLEITESVALHDLENTQRFIARIHDLGAKIALDDFGAGYTSFRYLKRLSADALKIDGEFVRSMREHPKDVAIVEALVSLAGALGMRSVAEWVEDADTLTMLRELGVDYVQGYAIARPLEPELILAAKSSADFVTDSAVASAISAKARSNDPFEIY
jgi:diguanylate cyclase (GGDEF)-like protein